MIVLTDTVASNSSIFAVKLSAQRDIYGGQVDTWLQSGPWGALALSRLSGITLCGDVPDGDALEELRAFLTCMGGPVEGDAALVRCLFPACPVFPVLAAPEKAAQSCRVTLPERLSAVYTLLCACDSAFAASSRPDAWLADFSHRCRHGYSDCFILKEENNIIATFSILFRGKSRAIGGAFAVHPRWRGQGLGSLLLSHGAAVSAARGERLFLIAADEARADYYRRRGWAPYGLAARCDNLEDI